MKFLCMFTISLFATVASAQPGTLDPTFGNGGKLTTPIRSTTGNSIAMAVQGNGQVVLAGYIANGSNQNFALARYTISGNPDATFGVNGIATTDIGSSNENIQAIAIQSDGKIVAAGYSGAERFFVLARYNSNGDPDAGFNGNGKLLLTDGGNIKSLRIQSDGKLLIAAYSFTSGNVILCRFNTDGSRDFDFGNMGYVTNAVPYITGLSLAIQGDGKIIVAGGSTGFSMARYNSNGSPDATFGNGGTVNTFLAGGFGFGAAANDIALQGDGKIVLAGFRESNYYYIGDFAYIHSTDVLARYNSNGSLDNSFNGSGVLYANVGLSNTRNEATGVAVSNNGKLIEVGASTGSSLPGFIAKFNGNGSLDPGFNGGTGSVYTNSVTGLYAVSLYANRIYTSGYTGNGAGIELAAYKNDPEPPIVTSLSPPAGPMASTITITGLNFNANPANNIVYFGAVRGAVTGGSATSLSVTIPPGATYKLVSVLDNVTGLTGYSTKPFLTTFTNPFIHGIPSNFYQPGVDFPAATMPNSIDIGDMDGDGKPDMVVSNSGSSSVSILRNISATGSITPSSFAPKVDFAIGSAATGFALGDIDGDGRLDIVAVASASSITILRNNSTPGSISSTSFAAKVDLTTGNLPYSVAVGDLDLDGKADIVVGYNNWHYISVLRNASTAGNITASSFSSADLTTGEIPAYACIGDVDGDGKPDIAVANLNSSTISVLRNTSSPGSLTASSFAAKVDLLTGPSPRSVRLGDIDGDNKADLVVANSGADYISVLRNKSTAGNITTASFDPKTDIVTGSGASSVIIGDADGDGKPELVAANFNSKTISILRNTTTTGSINASSFSPSVNIRKSTGPLSVALADADGDAIPELFSVSFNSDMVSVYKITDASNQITFRGKVYLQGAYNASSGNMNNLLNSSGILQAHAVAHPYGNAAFRYAGTEKVFNAFYNAHPDIVDWVLVELRSAATPSVVLATRAAFVKQDGTLVDIDALNPQVLFQGFMPGNYHIAIRHRNHLGIRSSIAINFSTGAGTYDFTTTANQSYQNQSYTSTVPLGGIYAMRAGNANSNSTVKYNGPENDQDGILNAKLGGSLSAILNNQYAGEDVNMDGTVKANGPDNDPNYLLNIILGGLLSTIYNEQL